MNFMETFAAKWNGFTEKVKPAAEKVRTFTGKAGSLMTRAWNYTVRLKKVLLAIPVCVGTVVLALRNMSQLPATVGLNLQTDGTFAIQIARELAVLGPVAVTALCLLLMFASKRTLTPWLVSMFSLALPLLIWVINVYPA